jgi:hypothetical protein
MGSSRRPSPPRFPKISQYAFGRTEPRRGRAAREALRDRVETLESRDPRTERYPILVAGRPPSGDGATLYFRERPLPPIRLPDGTRPFVLNTALTRPCFGGTKSYPTLSAPLLGPLWRACLAVRPANGSLNLYLRPPVLLASAFLIFRVTRGYGTTTCEASFTYSLGENDPTGLIRFVEALGLAPYARPEDLDPAAIARAAYRKPGHHHDSSLPLLDIPEDPSLPERLSDGLGRLGLSDTAVQFAAIHAADYEETYDVMRARLNAIAGGWICDFSAWYRAGFDPYLTPPEPPPGEEYRYPIAERDPYIQVDMVHAPEGSFLEFASPRGEAPVRYYADLADAEVEFWRGEPANRGG